MSYERAIKTLVAFDGLVEQATEDELANASRAQTEPECTLAHTQVSHRAVLIPLVERGRSGLDDCVGDINSARPTDFKVGYHIGFNDVIARHRNPPLELPADYDAVQRAIDGAPAR